MGKSAAHSSRSVSKFIVPVIAVALFVALIQPSIAQISSREITAPRSQAAEMCAPIIAATGILGLALSSVLSALYTTIWGFVDFCLGVVIDLLINTVVDLITFCCMDIFVAGIVDLINYVFMDLCLAGIADALEGIILLLVDIIDTIIGFFTSCFVSAIVSTIEAFIAGGAGVCSGLIGWGIGIAAGVIDFFVGFIGIAFGFIGTGLGLIDSVWAFIAGLDIFNIPIFQLLSYISGLFFLFLSTAFGLFTIGTIPCCGCFCICPAGFGCCTSGGVIVSLGLEIFHFIYRTCSVAPVC